MIPIVEQGAKIRNAVFWAGDRGCIIAGDKEADEQNLAQSLIFAVGEYGRPRFRFLDWIAHAACLLPGDKAAIVSSAKGRLLIVSGDTIQDGQIVFSDGSEEPFVLRSLRKIGTEVFGVGMSGLILQRRMDGLWEFVERPEAGHPGLEAIDGFATTELYAVGWNGALQWRDHSATVRNLSLTSVILTSVCCTEEGIAYACGQDGVILRGRHAKWEIICDGATDDNFWDIISFKGSIYVSTILSLYNIRENKLVLVDFGDDPPTSCYRLFSHGQYLWSIGRDDILRYNGARWTRIA